MSTRPSVLYTIEAPAKESGADDDRIALRVPARLLANPGLQQFADEMAECVVDRSEEPAENELCVIAHGNSVVPMLYIKQRKGYKSIDPSVYKDVAADNGARSVGRVVDVHLPVAKKHT
jgi:hypothetical protein